MGLKVVFQMKLISQLRVLMLMLLVHDWLELLYTLKHGEAINGPNSYNRIYMMNKKNMTVWV